MQLKAGFKDSILSLVSPKEPASVTNPEIRLQSDSSSTTKPKESLYSVLQTNEGFLALQEHFLKSLNEFHQEETGPPLLSADEFMLNRILSDVLENIEEIYLLDTFDTIDPLCTGSIGFKEFYMCVLLWAAKEEGQLTHALYMHGQRLYEMISGGQEAITNERLLRFGRILGFKEEVLLGSLEQVMSKAPSMANCQDFVTFYYYLFSQYDQTFEKFKAGSNAGSVQPKEVQTHKYAAPRVKGGCCTAKVCSIF
eukprot:TRINITY_DN120599_c0_g1_i1.p3 TRINITY_DN120599_c0_g1~~TRINITY_DN120599_c0_g1_i1.p3  ORF type:complete len:285 (-),score=27.04 TRINITY_DN120599_c0_g1_i1:3333-4091(-)